jgi:Zn-dependent protease with chaperone function
MATDFFQQQDAARRRTGLLIVYFALAVLSLIALTYLLFAVIFLEAGGQDTARFWNAELFVAVLAGVGMVVGGGSLFKIAELAGGGKTVALMLGGKRIPGNTPDLPSRRLLNVVEEMSIASGVPVPPVYVLPNESGINAFAAGHAPGDAVVAVSRGCLEYLTRDELQGVVAHEFSHILNGDMRLNIRLLGLIYGILALSTIGRLLIDVASRGRSSDKDRGRGSLMLLGLGLLVLGSVGAFFGWLIQAAVSRQREYLADASAVQFTRNPDGIGGALKKIGGLKQGSNIASPRAEEVSHMFFADGLRGRRFTDWFATHPPLDDRIKRLDPRFDGRYPVVKPVMVSEEERRGPQPPRIPPIIPGVPQLPLPVLALGPGAAASHVGRVTPKEMIYAGMLHSNIPETLRTAAHDPFSARALIYCLLLDQQPSVRAAQLAHLRAEADPRDYEQTLRLNDAVQQLPEVVRLPLVDFTIPALRHMSPRQHEVFRAQVEGLIQADQQVSIFEYALRSVLNRHLDAEFNRRRPRPWQRSRAKLAVPLTKVLSLLAWEGQPDGEKARVAFTAGMNSYLDSRANPYQLLPRDECTLAAFDAALRGLGTAVPELKRRIIMGCTACILADRQVTIREGELLRAISASLGCPMPPLVAEAA